MTSKRVTRFIKLDYQSREENALSSASSSLVEPFFLPWLDLLLPWFGFRSFLWWFSCMSDDETCHKATLPKLRNGIFFLRFFEDFRRTRRRHAVTTSRSAYFYFIFLLP
jgi:hypothetical protein